MSERATGGRRTAVRRITLVLVGVAVLAGAGAAFRADPIAVDVAVAGYAPLRVTVDAEGQTRVHDRYVIAAPVAGRLERMPVEEGDRVRAGEPIARLAPAPLDEPAARQARARLAAARALEREAATQVRILRAAAEQARRDEERSRQLLAAGAIAQRTLEEAELAAQARADELVAAQAHAAAAAAEVEQARAALLPVGGGADAAIVVRAPVDGSVLRLAGRSERVVSPGTTIAELGDLRGLEVVVDVLSSDAALVRPGMPVLLAGWAGEDSAVGRVRLVEPAATTRISALGVEEQRVEVLVDVLEAPTSLGDGYRVDANITIWHSDSALVVPTSALVRAGEEWAVFAVVDGRAALRPVRVGRMGSASVQIERGLASGDRVIVFPSDEVRDGVRVDAAS